MTNPKQRTHAGPALNALAITCRKIDDLVPNPENPRCHHKRQLRKLAESIRAFGFLVPVLVDRSLMVLAGHARLEAAKIAGLHEVPTILVDHLSKAQARAFTIADNRLSEIATWNESLLTTQLKELSALNLDFSIEATGFEVPEIDLRIEGEADAKDQDSEDEETILVGAGPAVSRLGMAFQLGRHTIKCANALDRDSYASLLNGELAAAGVTDSPYNVAVQGHISGKGKFRHREFAMASGELDSTQFVDFQTTYLMNMCNLLKPGSLLYSFMDWRHASHILEAGNRAALTLMNIAVWAKTSPSMGSMYRSQHELCFIFKHGRGRHRNNIELGRWGRNRSNLWTYPGANNAASTGEEGKLVAMHPTSKPVRLIADIILDCTARNDIVLEPFLGSGATLIAAERVGRRCVGIEIDPAYVDTVIRRWQAFTGEAAVEQSSGIRFDDLPPAPQGESNVK